MPRNEVLRQAFGARQLYPHCPLPEPLERVLVGVPLIAGVNRVLQHVSTHDAAAQDAIGPGLR